MRLLSICMLAATAAVMTSCGGYDNDKVRKINNVKNNEFTTEQEEYGLKLYIEFQEKTIDKLEEQLDDIEELVAEQKAFEAALKIYSFTSREDKETDAYKEVKDKIIDNDQKIKDLNKEIREARKEALKELGYTEEKNTYDDLD